MRKLVLSVLFIVTFFITNYAESATTSDGLITLDFYEDTQSGIDNRWILDMTVNDIGGGVESIKFETILYNDAMGYGNLYNDWNSDYYTLSTHVASTMPVVLFPVIGSDPNTLWIPTDMNFVFYAMPIDHGEYIGNPIVDEFFANINYYDNLGNSRVASLSLTGPVGFDAVPEPITMFLFAFGAFLLKFISKKK